MTPISSTDNKSPEAPAKPSDRYEIKFGAPESARSLVRSWARAHPFGFSRAFPDRIVNSLYFDTLTRSDLESGLAGVPDRSKLRLRWYGKGTVLKGAVFERKEKRGELGRKTSREIRGELDLSRLSFRELSGRLLEEELGPLKPTLLSRVLPVLYNRYLRSYLLSADGKIRLTIDTQLEFFDQTLGGSFQGRHRELRPSLLVVELKADSSHHRELVDAAARFPLRRCAFSKFAIGILGVNPMD